MDELIPLDLSGETRFYNGVEVDGFGFIPNKFIDRELWSRLPKTPDEPTVTVGGVMESIPMEKNDGKQQGTKK